MKHVLITGGSRGIGASTALNCAQRGMGGRGTGCTLAALSGDAARQPAAVKAQFALGIEQMLDALASNEQGERTRSQHLDAFARLVGALVLSRACPDDLPLADEILAACREQFRDIV